MLLLVIPVLCSPIPFASAVLCLPSGHMDHGVHKTTGKPLSLASCQVLPPPPPLYAPFDLRVLSSSLPFPSRPPHHDSAVVDRSGTDGSIQSSRGGGAPLFL